MQIEIHWILRDDAMYKNGNDEKGYLTMYSLLMLTQELCLHLIYTYIQYANVFMIVFFILLW